MLFAGQKSITHIGNSTLTIIQYFLDPLLQSSYGYNVIPIVVFIEHIEKM